MSKRKEAPICTPLLSFLAGVVLSTSGAAACLPSIDALSNSEQIPQQVLDRFCNPEAGYDSLLLIKAAVQRDAPIFRVIAVSRDDRDSVQSVRLYQFDQDGQGHPDFLWQPQAVIDFKGNSRTFEARVKGRKATVSFEEKTFAFDMGGLFGLTITQNLNPVGRITVDRQPASVVLIETANRENWRWVLDSGEQVRF